MIATLPMYDPPGLQAVSDRLWSGVRAALGQGPEQLSRTADPWSIWQSPDLLLSPTCRMPYRHHLYGKVTLVGAPVHDLPGATPGTYYSVIVSRADDPRAVAQMPDLRLAVNDRISQSGWSAPMRHLEQMDLSLSSVHWTGAHSASARAVADHKADLAGLDAVT